MTPFNGMGILLNPAAARRPQTMPTLFTQALATKHINRCAMLDELGAIACHVPRGERLLKILETARALDTSRDIIADILKDVSAIMIRRAALASRRFRMPPARAGCAAGPRHDDVKIAWTLLANTSLTEAAARLGYSKGRVSLRITNAPVGSPLAYFKGVFKLYQRRHSDDTIDELLSRGFSKSAVARKLGYSAAAITQRIKRAPEGSCLARHRK